MDRSSAVQQLPALCAVAIRLRDEGQADHVIAVALGIDEDQVPTLLQIASSKLTNLMAVDSGAPLGSNAPIAHMHQNPTRP